MRVLFTGASSFTGFWFVEELLAAGYEVITTFTGSEDSYDGLKKYRIKLLADRCTQVYSCPFGSPAFLDLIKHSSEITMFCHHGAQVNDYRSFSFPVVSALEDNTCNSVRVIEALQEKSCKGIILTGSVFEQNEGIGSSSLAILPYGLSKGLTSEIFQFYCAAKDFPLGKFVIPNPFGPLEEVRFISYLMNQWFADQPATVKTPWYVRDNIHVQLLAKMYRLFVSTRVEKRGFSKCSPSGYIMNTRDFTALIAREMRDRIGKACQVEWSEQHDFTEPMIRINSEPIAHLFKDWQESAGYDALAEYYLGKHHAL